LLGTLLTTASLAVVTVDRFEMTLAALDTGVGMGVASGNDVGDANDVSTDTGNDDTGVTAADVSCKKKPKPKIPQISTNRSDISVERKCQNHALCDTFLKFGMLPAHVTRFLKPNWCSPMAPVAAKFKMATIDTKPTISQLLLIVYSSVILLFNVWGCKQYTLQVYLAF